ncbi:MAG: dienelactone hydrolase family protein [Spirochaetales bacterium]|nr:dienelactone hydrolase family protein [Spirochaetales bacterium]
MRFIIDKKDSGGIPVLDVYQAQAGRKLPVILFLHGFGSKKERKLTHSFYLAEAGYFVCAFDAFDHGERLSDEYDALSSVEQQSCLFDIILDTSQTINSIIDVYSSHPAADTSRVGLIGTSMGAMTVFHYITHFRAPCVKVAMPIIGTPVWESNIKSKILEDLRFAPYFDNKKLKKIAREEPARFLDAIADFPLLVQNGVDDELMPIEDLRDFAGKAQLIYTKKECFAFHDYYDIGHEATDAMIETAIEWCKKYLL